MASRRASFRRRCGYRCRRSGRSSVDRCRVFVCPSDQDGFAYRDTSANDVALVELQAAADRRGQRPSSSSGSWPAARARRRSGPAGDDDDQAAGCVSWERDLGARRGPRLTQRPGCDRRDDRRGDPLPEGPGASAPTSWPAMFGLEPGHHPGTGIRRPDHSATIADLLEAWDNGVSGCRDRVHHLGADSDGRDQATRAGYIWHTGWSCRHLEYMRIKGFILHEFCLARRMWEQIDVDEIVADPWDGSACPSIDGDGTPRPSFRWG